MNKRKQQKILLAARNIEMSSLLDELSGTKLLLNDAYTVFNSTIDPELIESSIYEINSLQSKYSYLLREIKKYTGMGLKSGHSSEGGTSVYSPKGEPI